MHVYTYRAGLAGRCLSWVFLLRSPSLASLPLPATTCVPSSSATPGPGGVATILALQGNCSSQQLKRDTHEQCVPWDKWLIRENAPVGVFVLPVPSSGH